MNPTPNAMNLAKLSHEAERALEWINLTLGTLCIGVTVFMWSTSPRPVYDALPIVRAFPLLMFIALPLLLVTSAIPLFTNRRRLPWGLVCCFSQ